MDFDQVIKHFKGAEAAAAALGLKGRQSVHQWQKRGIPYLRQLDIERRTGGALKAVNGGAKKRARK